MVDQDRPHSKFVTFRGKSSFNALDRPDTQFDMDGKWYIKMVVVKEDEAALLELKKEGIKNKVEKTDDGYAVTFSRPVRKVYRGTAVSFALPTIEDKERHTLPNQTKIGFGSDVAVTIEVYYTKPRRDAPYNANARLQSVRIDNLVPYSRDEYDKKEQRAAKAADKVQPLEW